MGLKRVKSRLLLEEICHQVMSESSSPPAATDVGFFSFEEHQINDLLCLLEIFLIFLERRGTDK